jgi:hypothetical protein
LKGEDIPLVKGGKYLGVIFDRRITWRYHIDSIATKALQIFIIIYSLLGSELLSAKSELTFTKP